MTASQPRLLNDVRPLPMENFTLNRPFQLWHYLVSHSQLLLRSNKHGRYTTRVEVLFKGVTFLSLPDVMGSLSVSLCDPDQEPTLAPWRDLNRCSLWYRVETGQAAGYVAAVAAFVLEDDLDYHDPSGLLDDVSLRRRP